MAIDVVKKIIDVEKEGEDLIIKARMESSETQKSAKQEADLIIHKAKDEADRYYNEVILKYEEEAGNESKPIIEQSERVKEQIKNIPEGLLNRAVNMVIERIVNSHGDS